MYPNTNFTPEEVYGEEGLFFHKFQNVESSIFLRDPISYPDDT